MKFNPHGRIALEWKGNILVSRPKGPINAEGAKVFHRLVNAEISKKNFSCWARIIQPQCDDTLGTADSYNKLTSHLQNNMELGCVFLAIVGGSFTWRYCFEKAVQNIELPVQHFCNYTSAIDYLTTNIDGIYISE